MENIVEQMFAHANEIPLEEVCGLVISSEKKSMILKGVNTAERKFYHFDMNPDVYLQVPDGWEVTATYHSHPAGITDPSDADRSMCESSAMPMHIVCGGNRSHQMIQPVGFKAPYLKRSYVFGVHDCFSLVRDWYAGELGIELPHFNEERAAFRRGESVYLNNFEKAGFVDARNMPVLHGDLFFIQVDSKVPNHSAIWLDGGRILHHVVNRVSATSPWSGYWAQAMTNHLRHKTRL